MEVKYVNLWVLLSAITLWKTEMSGKGEEITFFTQSSSIATREQIPVTVRLRSARELLTCFYQAQSFGLNFALVVSLKIYFSK